MRIPALGTLLLAASLAAQEPATPAEHAWRAHRAAEAKNAAAAEALLQSWDTLRGQDGPHARAARHAVVAALVDLEADIPQRYLEQMRDDHLTEVLITLARDPRGHEGFLIHLLDRDIDVLQWTVAGGLLAQIDSPELAKRLFANLEFRADLYVTDTESASIDDPLVTRRAVTHLPPAGFPPRPVFTLIEHGPERGNLVDGQFPVGVQRNVAEATVHTKFETGHVRLDKDERRIRMLLAMARSEATIPAARRAVVTWDGAANYRERAGDIVAEREADLDRLVEILASANTLTSNEASSLRPSVTVHVVDQREDGDDPIPSLDKATIAVIGLIPWYTDYDTALAEAKRRKAPLWVHFGENPG